MGFFYEHPDDWLGISKSDDLDVNAIEQLISERSEARKGKDFQKADIIRDKLKEKGIEIEDTSEGTIWRSIKK